jgi:hypothetical protein
MTIFNFIKFVFILVSLIGVVFIGVGAWKMWSAYNFAKTAEKTQGTFTGYHEVLVNPTVPDSDGFKHKVKETYPMFAYTDAKGQAHHITGQDVIVFQNLKSGDPVDVLVSPDDPENARLGSAYHLYGGGGFLSLGGLLVIILLFYGFKALAVYIGPSAVISQTSLIAALQSFSQSKLPVGDFVIIAGGFVLLAGAMIGFGTHFILKRQDPSLVQAMEAGRFDEARMLALEGKGIEGKNAVNEPALIVALKANKPEVARAILSHWTSTNVVTSKGASGLSLAAANGDHITTAMMIKKGAETFGLDPSIVHSLIVKGDTETLSVIFSSSFTLDADYMRLTYGDHAVMYGKADVVRLIQKHNGPFKAPSSFIALVLDDTDALTVELKKPDACNRKFNRLTLTQFAEKIGKKEMIENAGGCMEPK